MLYIATFFTHFGAVKYQKFLVGRGIAAEKLPVPRSLSTNCGIGVRFETMEPISNLLTGDIEKVFLLQAGKEQVVYANEE